METYTSNKINTQMALNVTSEIQRKAFENTFFVHSMGCNPFVQIIPANTLLQFRWQLPVVHPLFCISSFNSPLFQSCSGGLEVCLSINNNITLAANRNRDLKILHVLRLTCIFPIIKAKSTSPTIAMIIEKFISPIYVLVERSCPIELHKNHISECEVHKLHCNRTFQVTNKSGWWTLSRIYNILLCAKQQNEFIYVPIHQRKFYCQGFVSGYL